MDIALLFLMFLIAALVFRWWRTKDPEPIFNVYSLPDKWYPFKYMIISLILLIRKIYEQWGLHHYPGLRKIIASTGTIRELKSRANITEMEKVQTLPNDAPLAVDAVFFVAASKNGCYFTAAIARRPNNIADAFWHFKIPNVGLLLSPKQPDTSLRLDPGAFSTEGLRIENVVPMKLWRIEYNGQMRLDGSENRMLKVSMCLEFNSEMPYFDFEKDLDWRLPAKGVAREPWNLKFIGNLVQFYQTHYEQMGRLRGIVDIEGYGEHRLDMDCSRDHSFDRHRDWKVIHRYVQHIVFVNDGTKFAVGTVSYPDTITAIEFRFLYNPTGKLINVESCDFEIFRYGEKGTPPTDYAFAFKADGQNYYVQCQVLETAEVHFGPEWEGRLVQRMCKYQVNGKSAWGFSDFEYRHYAGKGIRHRTTNQCKQ